MNLKQAFQSKIEDFATITHGSIGGECSTILIPTLNMKIGEVMLFCPECDSFLRVDEFNDLVDKEK